MTYKPHRDDRFEYVSDVMEFIEDMQCVNCAFSLKTSGDEYIMCEEIAVKLIEMQPVAALDDMGDDGVVCRAYRDDVLEEEAHPDQLRLFGE